MSPESDSNRPSPEQAKRSRQTKYLTRTLSMNPMYNADKIIQLRGRLLGQSNAKTPGGRQASTDVVNQREKITAVIDKVRKRFWSMDQKELNQSLSKLNLDPFPDLKNAAHRLMVVAQHRRVFPQLAQHHTFVPLFWEELKNVLTLGPREAADFRDQAYHKLPRSTKLRKIQRMVKHLRKECPEVYELESDWLDSVLKLKRSAVTAKATESGSSTNAESEETNWGCMWWIIGFAIYQVIRLAVISGQ